MFQLEHLLRADFGSQFVFHRVHRPKYSLEAIFPRFEIHRFKLKSAVPKWVIWLQFWKKVAFFKRRYLGQISTDFDKQIVYLHQNETAHRMVMILRLKTGSNIGVPFGTHFRLFEYRHAIHQCDQGE